MFYKNQTKADLRYMKSHKKVLKTFSRLNPRTKHHIQWVKLEVPREPVNIFGVRLRVNHIYETPKKSLKDPKMYLDPMNDLDHNSQCDFKAYRKKLGLMTPQLIIRTRKKYRLSISAMSKLLKINKSDYVMIENGNLNKEKEWYSKLYKLLQPKVMQKLIKNAQGTKNERN